MLKVLQANYRRLPQSVAKKVSSECVAQRAASDDRERPISACFTCAACHRPCSSTFFLENDQPYCESGGGGSDRINDACGRLQILTRSSPQNASRAERRLCPASAGSKHSTTRITSIVLCVRLATRRLKVSNFIRGAARRFAARTPPERRNVRLSSCRRSYACAKR